MDVPKVILVVDDEVMLRNMIRTLLSKKGYAVLIAADGNEALEVSQAHEGWIDLVLTDVEIPQLGGIEAYQRIRHERPAIKVLFMSAPRPNRNHLSHGRSYANRLTWTRFSQE
jgi:two-component system, cell cycle sensor histidine kinase and response regulator CckA